MSRRLRAEWVFSGALFFAPFVLFHDVLDAYWRADDPAILLHAISSPWLADFHDPLIWRKLSPSNLTPWLTLSFHLDHFVAGAKPQLFYFHQLLACSVVAVAAYRLAREWAPPLVAFLGVVLFLCGASTASVVELLMTRHYLEGMVFSLLALLGFLRALDRRDMRWAWAGALAYMLASMAKEVYVPLVLVLLVVPRGSLYDRLRMALPFLTVAVLYVPWRGYMLGSLIGGYSSAGPAGVAVLSEAARTALKLPAFVLGPYWAWIGGPLALLLMARAVKDARLALLVGVVAAAVLLPLIPLVRSPGIAGPDRYTFVLWFVVCMACSWLLRPIGTSWVGKVALAGVLASFAGVSVAYQHAQRHAHMPSYLEFEVQGRFVEHAQRGEGMVPSDGLLAVYWYAKGLQGLRAREGLDATVLLIRGMPATAAVDTLYRYDPALRQMRRVDEPLAPFIARWTASDQTAALSVDLRLEDAAVQWSIGPYDEGQYFIASDMTGRYPIPRQGRVNIVFDTLSFQIQHLHPDGRLTASPVMNVQPGGHVTWTRP